MNPTTEKPFFTINVIGALILGLILGFILGAYYGRHAIQTADDSKIMNEMDEKDGTSTIKTLQTNSTVKVEIGKSAIVATDMKAGSSATLSTVNLDKSYWVAIRDSSTDVKIPYILGARRIQAGSYNDVIIHLTRSMIKGKTYEVVLYKAGTGAFNYDASNLVPKDGSTVAYTTFKAE